MGALRETHHLGRVVRKGLLREEEFPKGREDEHSRH